MGDSFASGAGVFYRAQMEMGEKLFYDDDGHQHFVVDRLGIFTTAIEPGGVANSWPHHCEKL